jgi:hypothetical protein
MAEEMERVDLDSIPTVEVGVGIDLDEFIGQRKKIERVGVLEVVTHYDEAGKWNDALTRKVKVIKVETEVITVFKDKEGKNKEIRASELFNMIRNKDGNWGISTSPKSKIQKFLARQKVKKLSALVGTAVVLKDHTDKNKNTYLGFVTE